MRIGLGIYLGGQRPVAGGVPAPITTSLSATSGTRFVASQTCTINGSNLGGGTVTFGSTSGIVPSVDTGTALTFTIPQAEVAYVGPKNVSVTTLGGPSNAQVYTVNPFGTYWWTFDSSQIVYNGLNIAANQCRITAELFSQGTATAQPLWVPSDANWGNRPGALLDGVDDYLQTGLLALGAMTQPNTIYIAGRVISGASGILIDGNSLRQAIQQISNIFSISAGSTIQQTGNNCSTRGIYGGVFNGANAFGFKDSGAAIVTGNCNTGAPTALRLGISSTLTLPAHAELFEIIVRKGVADDLATRNLVVQGMRIFNGRV